MSVTNENNESIRSLDLLMNTKTLYYDYVY